MYQISGIKRNPARNRVSSWILYPVLVDDMEEGYGNERSE